MKLVPLSGHFGLGVLVVLVFGAACAPRWVKRVTVNVVPEFSGAFRIDVALAADRRYPECRIVSDNVRATVDGVAMRALGRGRAPLGTMISGVELPPVKECDGWAGFTTFGPLAAVPDGTATSVVIEDGPHRLELSIMDARARYRTELVGGQDVTAGDIVTVVMTPERDLPLPSSPGGQINIYAPHTRVAVLQGADIRVAGRRASFKVPALPPGEYKVVYNVSSPPLEVVRCRGVPACEATRLLAPDSDVVLRVH